EHTRQTAAHPQPRLAQRIFLRAEDAVKAHCVVDLGRAQVQQAGDLADRLQRHAPEGVLHDVQGRQRHRLLARIARDVGQDLLPQFFAEYTHRSNSAAMMFRLPSTATTSLIWWPTIRYG